MENSLSMITMLMLAFLAGIVLFVAALRAIRELQKERRLAHRRKTTSMHMAKVVGAAADKLEEAALDAGTAGEAGEGAPSESVNDAQVEDTADEHVDDDDSYSDEAAGNKFDDEDIAEEDAVEEGTAEESDAGALSGAASFDVSAEAADDDTRETRAVSLAENEPANTPLAAPAGPVNAAKLVQSIRMQPIQPLRTLRMAEDKADGKQKAAGVQKRRLPETVKMKERKVLMAEDVKVHRELIEMFFEGSGVKFEFAENGKDACDMFEESPDKYSLILMDIHMPVMDGYEAAKKIRAMDIDWAKQIPIVAMTADTTEDDLNKCFEAGMDDHVVKPIDMAILQDRVFEFVTRDSE